MGAQFPPCNSVERRCIVCLELGRIGSDANRVSDIATGMCEEHVNGVQTKRPSSPERRMHIEIVLPDLKARVSRVQNDQPVEEVVVFEKKRRKPEVKLAALEEAFVELQKEKQQSGQNPQIDAHELFEHAAKKLHMSSKGLATYFYRSVPEETRARWLCGEAGRRLTRAEIKFNVLLQVREQFRGKGGPSPRKKELAEVAAGPLGMKLDSVRTYIYDRLTPEQVKQLDLREQFLTRLEQIDVLREVRRGMKEKGLPPPRQEDLAIAAAPLLKQKPSSVRTLIGRLPKEIKEELNFLGSQPKTFTDVDPEIIRQAFVGAAAVLRLRKLPSTLKNVGTVLKLKPEVIRSYLDEHPDLEELLLVEGI